MSFSAIHYRGYVIEYDPPPIPISAMNWQFYHEGYNGPEDCRWGVAPTLDDAKAEIDELIEEEDAT